MASRAVSAPFAQLPNALTLGRLAPHPGLCRAHGAGGGRPLLAGWDRLRRIAGITDQIDGFLARRWHVESRFGKIADPLADRLMIDSAVILLVVYGRLRWVALAIILARDLLLLIGWRVLTPRGIDLDVNRLGKAATWILYLAIGCRIVTHDDTTWPLWLFWIGLGMALVATMFYVRDAWRALRA